MSTDKTDKQDSRRRTDHECQEKKAQLFLDEAAGDFLTARMFCSSAQLHLQAQLPGAGQNPMVLQLS
jgi:hypothetical protein